jgi:predicted nucleotidyltransferase
LARDALDDLATVLDGLGIRWVLIGALAANRYRVSPRLTADVDLLLAESGHALETLEAALEDAGWAVRRASPAGEVLRLRHARFGAADLLIAGTEYQREAIERARVESVGHRAIRILRIEDVIVHKLIAGRTQDRADIEAILAAGSALDDAYVERWAAFWDVLAEWNRVRSQ